MGFDAYTHANDGAELLPLSRGEWQDWVAASRTRWCLNNPLLDWLHF